MIPYIKVPDLDFGKIPILKSIPVLSQITIHPFGVLVAVGVLIGTRLALARAKKLGYQTTALNSFITWMLVSGFVISHVFDEVFYHWQEIVRNPLELLDFRKGLSSFGGFAGAAVGIVLWKYFEIHERRFRRRAVPHPVLPFSDVIISVFPVAWIFGRAGCSVVHDHPGARTAADELLAVAYPLREGDGAPPTTFGFIEFYHGHAHRYDLGFLELLFTLIVAGAFALTWRRKLPVGTYLVVAPIAYAPVRFAMDFLRVPESEGGDTRYAGLTPAQFAAMALFAFGLFMIPMVRKTMRETSTA